MVEHAFIDGSAADQAALYNDANLVTMGRLDAQAIAEHYGFTKGAPKAYVKKMVDGATTVAWQNVSGAERYCVAKYENGTYYNYDTNITSNEYTVNDLVNGQQYTFLVQA